MQRRRQQGFTLIEAMIVVAIIGILAAIGYAVLQKMIWRARYNEVPAMFDGIIAKEQAHFAEFRKYVANGFVPAAPQPNSASPWPATGSATIAGFDTIGFTPDTQQVWHSYRVVVCNDVSQAPCNSGPCNNSFPTGYTGAGFIVEALGDVNGDGNLGQYCATSHSTVPIIWDHNEDWEGQENE